MTHHKLFHFASLIPRFESFVRLSHLGFKGIPNAFGISFIFVDLLAKKDRFDLLIILAALHLVLE